MTPLTAVLRGAGALRRGWRIWLLVSALTLAFALFLALPIAAVVYGRLGHSLYAGRMLANFDLQWLAEFRNDSGNWPLFAAAPAFALVSGAYLLLMTFLYGGALSVFTGTGAFWSGCGRNFWRLTKLLAVSMACYAIVYLIHLELGKAGQWLWGRGMVERPVVIFGWVRAGTALLLFLFVNMVFDYAKIRLVADDGRRALAAVRDSLGFVARHPAATVGTYALISLAAVAVAAIYWLVAGILPTTALVWIALLLVVQQSFVAVRLWLKLLYLSAQTEVWLGLPAPQPSLNQDPQPGSTTNPHSPGLPFTS